MIRGNLAPWLWQAPRAVSAAHIGGLVVWPDEVRAKMAAITSDADAFLQEVQANEVPETGTNKPFLFAYSKWLVDWYEWRDAHSGYDVLFFSSAGVWDETLRWEAQLKEWRKSYKGKVITPGRPDVPQAPPSALENVVGDLKWVALAGLGIAAIVAWKK